MLWNTTQSRARSGNSQSVTVEEAKVNFCTGKPTTCQVKSRVSVLFSARVQLIFKVGRTFSKDLCCKKNFPQADQTTQAKSSVHLVSLPTTQLLMKPLVKQGPALYKEPWTAGQAVSHFTLDADLSTSPGRAICTGLLYMLLLRTVLAKTNKGRHSETIFLLRR